MKPVMIRAFGRTGTTLMMQLLNTAEEVMVPNSYPFESRFLSYFARLAKVPTNPISDIPSEFSWDDGQVLQGESSLIGPMPYECKNYVDIDRLSARFLIALWNQFTQEIEMKLDKTYTYYAEKVSMDGVHFIHRVLNDSKSIYIVRDPRAELASIMSFNKKMGYETGFGWQKGDTAASFAERMVASRKTFFRSVMQFYLEKNENSITIRYEDLIVSSGEISELLSEFLGVKLNYDMVESNKHDFSHHMTNSNAKQSIDSWKAKIPKDAADILTEGLKEELQFFKYEV